MSRQGIRPADIRLEQQRATTARGTRSPEYNFRGSNLSEYTLVPTFFAPVLAGDTVAQATAQCRVIASAQDNNTVIGAWFEHWFFNVRIGDMPSAESIRDLLIDPAASAAIDWRDECMQSIWKYFRDESEASSWSATSYLRNPRVGWWDSSRGADDLPDTSGASDEWDEQWIRYQAMRRAKITTKTYEEYLASQGVNVPVQLRAEHDPEFKMPELLSYTREFVYPQMSMAPVEGGELQPLATLQWFINDRLKRSRFISEPGFIVGCVAMRRKAYAVGFDSLGGSEGVAFDPLVMLNDAMGWQPIDLDTDPHTSLVSMPAIYFGDTVPGAEQIIDSRDLLLYGQDEWQKAEVRNQVNLFNGLRTPMAPKNGSRPDELSELITYQMDSRYKLNVKSRVSKDTTR